MTTRRRPTAPPRAAPQPVAPAPAQARVHCPQGQGRLDRRSIAGRFQRYFGSNNKLKNWQRLCRDVGIGVDIDVSSLKKCKEALGSVWINIYDLVEAVESEALPLNESKKKSSQKALAKYSKENDLIFPKKEAKEGGPVRCLLAHIFH